jgi:hypothetical protein
VRPHRASQLVSPAYSVLGHLAKPPARSAAWLAHLRPGRAWPRQELHWLAVPPVKSAEVPMYQQQEQQAQSVAGRSCLVLSPGALSSGALL